MNVVTKCLFIFFAMGMAASSAQSQTIIRKEQTTGASGLPTPRFVSLNVAKANMRTGPGEQYPILWVYVREDLPLEVTDEYGAWRRIRDNEGTTGWMHGALLSGRRTGVISGATRTLHAEPDAKSKALIRAEPGVVLSIESCQAGWCEVEIRGRSGWIPQDHFWGTYDQEVLR
jgi:SH3-like domain-containing protein